MKIVFTRKEIATAKGDYHGFSPFGVEDIASSLVSVN
jgi:hypothetical protein